MVNDLYIKRLAFFIKPYLHLQKTMTCIFVAINFTLGERGGGVFLQEKNEIG